MRPVGEHAPSVVVATLSAAFGVSLLGQGGLRRGAGLAPALVASGIKVLLMPAVAFLLGALVFGLEGLPLLAAVLIGALPTGQMVFSYAARYGVGVALARNTVLISTVACVPVVIVIALLFG